MKFSFNWLKELSGVKLTVAKLEELLSLRAFEIKEIQKTGNDWVLDIDVLPNRAPDCFSHLGMAREISAILNCRFQIEKFKLIEDKIFKAKDFLSVEVESKIGCSRYTARVITDVEIEPSPKWVQEKLTSCGLRPINNIVDITNYVMLETGQPLHAFDFQKLESANPKSKISNLKSKKIIVRFAKKGEKITTLDDQKFNLDPEILVIADANSPIAIAGIKGGKTPEIDKKTKTIILEAANFNPRIVRKGSRKLNLKTDASARFEHGLDPNLTESAINLTSFLIQKIAKGKVSEGLVDYYLQKALPKIVNLDLSYLNKTLGREIPKNKAMKLLRNLGFEVKTMGKDNLKVIVPTRRLDISIPEDLIEEVGRLSDYNLIEPKFPLSLLVPPKRNLEIFWEDFAKRILKEFGFTEVYNYSFVSSADARVLRIIPEELIGLKNPLNEKERYLRPSLLPNLFKNIQKNQKIFSQMRIFELGKVFSLGQPEKRMLSGLIKEEKFDFRYLKGIVDSLLVKFGVSDICYNEFNLSEGKSKFGIHHPRRSAEINIEGETVGYLGDLSRKILDELKIEGNLLYFDLDFEKLMKLATEEHEYWPISRFPAAVRDIAVLVPKNVRVEEVLNKIEVIGGKLIQDIDLFDIYEGEELPENKKNLAFHIIYQAEDRTLTSSEIEEIQRKIVKTLEQDPEWEVRR